MGSRLTAAIDAFEADGERLAEAQAQAVLAHFPSYRAGAVPLTALVASGRHNVEQAVAILRCGRAPDRQQLDEGRRIRERASQGVPAAEMHDAYRLCLRIIGDAFISTATAARLAQPDILAATRLLWESADILTSVVLGAREAFERDSARHDQDERTAFLRGLVYGTVSPPMLREQAAAFGLSTDRSYFALRARATAANQRDELASRLDTLTRTHACRPLLGLIDGDVVGVVPHKPVWPELRHTIGIGGPLALDSMPRAFAAASRLLDVASALGRSGCFELGNLTLQVAIAAEPELGALLVERYLLPLRHEGDFGAELEQTLRTHLAHGSRINDTARVLGLHPNTVRHRLARCETLTGARLDVLAVQFEIWWALQWLEHVGPERRG